MSKTLIFKIGFAILLGVVFISLVLLGQSLNNTKVTKEITLDLL